MKIPKLEAIEWRPHKDFEDCEFPPYVGLDANGNRFYTSGNRETVSVILTDGRKGHGWSEEEAWRSAHQSPPVRN